MNAQLEMPLVDVPRARNSDPESSHRAAETIADLPAQQDRAYRAVRLYPGSTARELAHHLAQRFGGNELAYYASLHRRLAELNQVRVKSGELRKCRQSGRLAQTWWVL